VSVQPSHADALVAAGSERIGGPIGRFARSQRWWTPLRVLIVLAALGYLLGYLLDVPCRMNSWASPDRYEHLCYSDIPPLYTLRGFAEGYLPYFQQLPGQMHLEYPVLTGVFMQIASVFTKLLLPFTGEVDAGTVFFDVNVVLLFIPLLVAVITTALVVKRRPWDAAMVALAPTVILAGTINWDLIPLGLTGLALLAWSRRNETSAGIWLGLAIAAKFYPVLLLGAFLVLALRSGRWAPVARLVIVTAITWLVVNLPFMIFVFDGWLHFYAFSQERGVDFGSPWFAMTQLGLTGIPSDQLNTIGTGAFLLLCLGIAVLALRAEQRPRLAALCFLIVAAFAITNKVYSPQYVLWLVPLAVLARPRWRDFLIWQACEVVYFAGIWWFLVGYGTEEKGLTPQWYGIATFVHIVGTIWFASLIIRDILKPEHDVVRTDGFAEDEDDPMGGVFDRAPDRFVLRQDHRVE
jgi:uncharacterized membrane protein